MKRWLSIISAFLAGAAIASVGWGWHYLHFQIEMVALHAGHLVDKANIGEQILSYTDNPDPRRVHRLNFTASNLVARFPGQLEVCDKLYPYLHLKRREAAKIHEMEELIRERRARFSTNSVVGASK